MCEAAGDGNKGRSLALPGACQGGFPVGRRYQNHARALLIAGPNAQRAAECARHDDTLAAEHRTD
jgi:hypothetical protein